MRKKYKIISLIIIVILIVVESGLVYLTIEAINAKNNTMDVPHGEMGQSSNINYSAKTEITKDSTIKDEEYKSETADENAVLVSESTATMEGISVTKTGSSDGGDNTSFYGTNSAIVAKEKANLTIKEANITTDATGANGVFCFGGSATTKNASGDGTTVNISNSTITTIKDNSGGIMTTGGGKTYASNLTINTAGTSSAAIRSDRGGGTVNVNGGTYTTTGQGSPSIYSTANISVKNANLISKASEGVVIEGKNSISLENCSLNDNNTKLNGQSTTYKNIFLYQSMSGDADDGTSTFTAKNSKITTSKGDTFYVTNTNAVINIENNIFTNRDSTGYFLRIQKDSWGNEGSNGGSVSFNMSKQNANGNIYVDSISTLNMSITDNSYFAGAINSKNCAESISLNIDASSKIKLTGDTYLSSLKDEDSTYSNIDFNGHKLFVNSKEISK